MALSPEATYYLKRFNERKQNKRSSAIPSYAADFSPSARRYFQAGQEENVPTSENEVYTSADIQNPVLDYDAPDPGATRLSDGGWLVLTTQTNKTPTEQWCNLPGWITYDWKDFKFLGDVLQQRPKGNYRRVCGDIWAPHPFMYEGHLKAVFNGSYNQEGEQGLFFGSFHGRRLDAHDTPFMKDRWFRGIDAYPYFDPYYQQWYMYYGSYPWTPIRAGEFNPQVGQYIDKENLVEVQHPTQEYPLIEGTVVVPRFDQKTGMYLGVRGYFSGHNAYGDKTYSVLTATAKGPLEPFGELTPVLEGNDEIINVGHNDVIIDDLGQQFMPYHGYDVREIKEYEGLRRYSETLRTRLRKGEISEPEYFDTLHKVWMFNMLKYKRRLYLDRINEFPDGRVQVNDGTPSMTLQKGPAVKNVRNIVYQA